MTLTLILGVSLLLPAIAGAAHDHGKLPNRLRVEPNVRLDLGISDRGTLPLYVRIRNAEIGRAAGYGVRIWVDTVQIYTNESVATEDYSFTLDLRLLGVGYHYVLANVCDHNDHVGASGMWIQITPDLRVKRHPGTPSELVDRWRKGETDWPGKLSRVSAPADTLATDTWLNCCGEHNPWPLGANDRDFFVMIRP